MRFLKPKLVIEEADKRYGVLLKGFQSYGERLKSEHSKLQQSLTTKEPTQVTGAESERLLILEQKIKEYEQNQNVANEQRFADA